MAKRVGVFGRYKGRFSWSHCWKLEFKRVDGKDETEAEKKQNVANTWEDARLSEGLGDDALWW